MAVSQEIQALLERMKTNPDEFMQDEWNPVQFDAWDLTPWEHVRWGNIVRNVFKTGNEMLFSEEDEAALRQAYIEMMRNKVKSAIMVELVGGERAESISRRRAEDMRLPYAPGMPRQVSKNVF